MGKAGFFLFFLFFIGTAFCVDVSVTATVSSTNSIPATPLLIDEDNKTSYGTITLEWLESDDDENDLVLYFLRVGTSSGGNNTLDINTGDLNYSVSISTNGTYYWSLKACDNNDSSWGHCSNWSIEDTFVMNYNAPQGDNPGGGGGGSTTKKEQVDTNDLEVNSCEICSNGQKCDGKYIYSDGQICCFNGCGLISGDPEPEYGSKEYDEVIIDNFVLDMKQIYNKEDMTFEDDEIGLKDYVLDTNKIKITLRVKTTKLLSNFKFEGYRIHFDYFISSQEGVIEKPFILLDYDPKLIPNAKLIQSEQDFFVVNDSTVIGIIPTILTSQEYLFSFYVDLKDKPDDDLWLNLKKPLVYVKNKELCTSVKCDDFDACTSDSCSNGKCAHLNICEQEKPSVGSYILYYIIGALLLMVLVAAYLLKKH